MKEANTERGQRERETEVELESTQEEPGSLLTLEVIRSGWYALACHTSSRGPDLLGLANPRRKTTRLKICVRLARQLHWSNGRNPLFAA